MKIPESFKISNKYPFNYQDKHSLTQYQRQRCLKEFNHLSTNMIVFGSLQNLMPFKSMPKKRNHDLMRKHPYIKAGTNEPLCIIAILTKNCFFSVCQRFRI